MMHASLTCMITTTHQDGTMLKTKEHEDLMGMFEREHKGMRIDREQDKGLWIGGNIYQDGHTNRLFLAYRQGYSYGRAIGN